MSFSGNGAQSQAGLGINFSAFFMIFAFFGNHCFVQEASRLVLKVNCDLAITCLESLILGDMHYIYKYI